ncbi:hypothetical protein AWT69_003051 [Pseudomonas putida]|nr:hypothetical protein AWT69_003051 [Pseudomonas putida]
MVRSRRAAARGPASRRGPLAAPVQHTQARGCGTLPADKQTVGSFSAPARSGSQTVTVMPRQHGADRRSVTA